jgi:hypothetical protein
MIAAYEMNWNIQQMREYFGKGLPEDQRLAVETALVQIYPDILTRDCSNIPKFKVHD